MFENDEDDWNVIYNLIGRDVVNVSLNTAVFGSDIQ